MQGYKTGKKEGKVLVMTSVLNLEPSLFITVENEATNVIGRGTKIWLHLI